jgi:hypothetical protein
MWPISTRVNSPRNDTEDILERVEAPPSSIVTGGFSMGFDHFLPFLSRTPAMVAVEELDTGSLQRVMASRAPATPADERSSSPVTLPTRDHTPQEPAPAVNGERGGQGLDAPEERSKLEDIDARSSRSLVPRLRLLPSQRRIVEEQEQREEFLVKTHRLRDLRLAREAEERAAAAKSGGEEQRDSL